MAPRSDDFRERRMRVELADALDEETRLQPGLDDDAVGARPPDLERDTGGGDRPRVRERAARRVRGSGGRGRSADLPARQLPLGRPGGVVPVAVLAREVDERVDGDGAG